MSRPHARPLPSPRVAAVALAVLFALTCGVAEAQTAPAASFSVSPESPVAGQEVAFADTSTGFSASATRDWDLDDDGAFDDASGPTATRSFAAGEHEVALRVRQPGAVPIERVARRTLTVTPTPTPAANEAPKAALELGCHKVGGTFLFCPGLTARTGRTKAFDASPSSDPDGSIVRYEWDLDGDGAYERDTGADPKTSYVYTELLFRGRATVKVGVRVTDDKGASAERTHQIRLLPAGCQEHVVVGALAVHGECFRRHKTLGLESFISEPGLPVSVNGIAIAPRAGKRVEVLVRDGKARVQGTGVVTAPIDGVQAKLVDGAFSWGVAGDRLTGFEPSGDARLNGLRITGVPQQPRLLGPRASNVWFHVALPSMFGGSTSDEPLVARPGAANASGSSDALEFGVENASLGVIELKQLRVAYDGEDLWEIAASVALPEPIPFSVSGGVGIRDGEFNYATGAFEPGPPGIPLGPVFLQRISFRVEVKPKQSECVPNVGVVHSDDMPAQQQLEKALGIDIPDVTYDYGIPEFALCGEVGLTGGPTLLGAAALRLNAGLGFVTFADRPAELRAHGQLYVVEIPLAKANFVLATDGYVRASARFHFGWDDVAHIEGFIALEMLAPKFNAHGRVKACLDFVDWCAGADALVSSRGVAVCLRIDLGLDDWSPGFGYRWGDTFPDLYFSGCDVGEYKEHIDRNLAASSAAARSAGFEESVEIPAGLPGAVISVEGRDAPPQVTLVSPDGERVTAPTDMRPLQRKPYLVLKDPRRKVTQFAIGTPAGGRWKVEVDAGSSPVTSIKSANGLERADVRARVRGSGHRRAVAYRMKPRPGQKVTFVERGPSGGTMIGSVRDAAGRLAFRPGTGEAERREIVAIVSQDGHVRDEIRVASYHSPGPQRAGRVRGLHARKRGGRAVLHWKRAASQHEVRLRLSDGRRLRFRTRRTKLVVPGIGRRVRGTVSVRGLVPDGMPGRAAKRRL